MKRERTNKYKLCIFLAIFILVSFQHLDASIKIWNSQNSPYRILEKITINSTDTLIIQSGTTIIIEKQGEIMIEGQLQMTGMKMDSIRVFFQGENGIHLKGVSEKSDISHVTFQGLQRKDQPTNSFFSITDSSEVIFSHCQFYEHQSLVGTALQIYDSQVQFSNCQFFRLHATQKGGVISTENSTVTILTSLFRNNSSGLLGGCLESIHSNFYLESCVIKDNQSELGGFLMAQARTKGTFLNCTLYANLAAKGAISYLSSGSEIDFTNSIMWLNTSSSGLIAYANDDESKVLCQFCCFEDDPQMAMRKEKSIPLVTASNIYKNPQFLTYSVYPLSLSAESPCLNQGKTVFFRDSKDYRENPRILQEKVDLGAYEWDPKTAQKRIFESYQIFYYSNRREQNKPILFLLENIAKVRVQIYDEKGFLLRELRMESAARGEHEIYWDGLDLSGKKRKNGYYFYQVFSNKP